MDKNNATAMFLLGRLVVGTFFLFAGLDSLVNVEQHLQATGGGQDNPIFFVLVASVLLVCGAVAVSTATYVILSNLWALRK